MTPPVVVVGAGAAGLMAAIFARRAGARVVLLERTRDGGRKILISGGGRCNILPSRMEPHRFVTASSPNSLRNILRSWPLDGQRAFFERELGLPLVLEPETGKLFPVTHRARDVRDGLVALAREAGVELRFGTRVTAVRPRDDAASGWWVEGGGTPLAARSVVLATGGLSVPATGSDGFGLEAARALGHTVNPTYPALTPLIADPPVHAHLAGVSLAVTLRAPGARPRFETTGGFLFTHRGYSGPAVLDASHLAVRSARQPGTRQRLAVQWTARSRDAWDEALQSGAGTVGALLSREMPTRLGAQLLREAGVDAACRLAHLPREARGALTDLLTDYTLPWTGDASYRKAEVTGGGVALAEIDPRTMESRLCRGLFLCGEMLDVFGPIGGYNFQWAWATGRAAGLGAARSSEPAAAGA